MKVFVTGILNSLGNDDSKRRMICRCIGMRLVTGILYVLVRILEGMVVMGILFTLAIIIITVVVVAGVILVF